jgi:hypothetical protein
MNRTLRLLRAALAPLCLLACLLGAAGVLQPASAQVVRTYVAYVGAYSGATVYNLNDMVLSGSTVYISLSYANAGNAPSTSPSFWQAMSGAVSSGGSVTINGTTCTIGSTCTIPAGATSFSQLSGVATPAQLPAATNAVQGAVQLPTGTPSASNVWCGNQTWCTPTGASGTPPLTYTYYRAAVSDGGTAFASSFTRYASNGPQSGSVAAATSGLGYLLWNLPYVSPQYAELTVTMPPFWTTANMTLQFYSTVTTGNSVMDIQTACVTANQVVGAPTFSAAIVTTTAVSATAGGSVQTASIANIATPGLNGCPALGMTTPTLVTIRLFADNASAVLTYFLGATLVTGRSQ